MSASKRERQLARQRYERKQARRAAARARTRRRQQIAGAVIGVLAVVGGLVLLTRLLIRDDAVTASPPAEAGASPSPSASPVCQPAPTSTPKPQRFAKEPPLTVKRTTYTATLKTNCGDLVLALDATKAPRTVNSFLFLAAKNYFDGAPCHRLTTAGIFVLQCGDPTGTGTGGPGYRFPDENLPKKGAKNYPAGTIAMANSGPNTNGSQFFIVYQDTQLPPNYTIFGRLVAGGHVLDKVRFPGVQTAGETDGPPKQKISILDVVTTQGAP